jgi:hypothetical protein
LGEEKKKRREEFTTEFTEDTEKRDDEKRQRMKSGKFAALDRKSPPFAEGAKGRPPSGSDDGCRYLEDQLGDSLWPVVVS